MRIGDGRVAVTLWREALGSCFLLGESVLAQISPCDYRPCFTPSLMWMCHLVFQGEIHRKVVEWTLGVAEKINTLSALEQFLSGGLKCNISTVGGKVALPSREWAEMVQWLWGSGRWVLPGSGGEERGHVSTRTARGLPAAPVRELVDSGKLRTSCWCLLWPCSQGLAPCSP